VSGARWCGGGVARKVACAREKKRPVARGARLACPPTRPSRCPPLQLRCRRALRFHRVSESGISSRARLEQISTHAYKRGRCGGSGSGQYSHANYGLVCVDQYTNKHLSCLYGASVYTLTFQSCCGRFLTWRCMHSRPCMLGAMTKKPLSMRSVLWLGNFSLDTRASHCDQYNAQPR
jgi:hypothetical protein